MKKGFNIVFILIIAGILSGVAVGAYAYRFKFYEYRIAKERAHLPEPVANFKQEETAKNTATSTDSANTATTSTIRVRRRTEQEQRLLNLIQPTTSVEKPTSVPNEINLAVPFMVQAPFAVWDVLHEDACEEASAIMLARFYQNKPIASAEDANEEIKRVTRWEDEHFGFNKDTSAALTSEILRQFYNLENVRVKYDSDVTIESIKQNLAVGKPVVVPNYGRALKNPFFRSGGPTYHMLVIKGYTKDEKFIVNDPGTKRGADFVYPQDRLYNAINDWDNENGRLSGRKAMIIVSNQ